MAQYNTSPVSRNLVALRKAGPPAAGKPVDPLGQTTPAQIQARVNQTTGQYGTPQTDSQIQTTAQGQIDPIIAALTSTINARAGQASSNIAANASRFASDLQGMDFGAPYAGAQERQAAVDAALQQSLNGAGSGLSQDLSSRLGVIADPSVAAAAGGLQTRGTALGTTELARGSAALSQLIGNQAASREYGAKQPGIARLAGLQDIAGVQQGAVNDVGTATTSLMQQLPSIVSGLRSQNESVRANRANAASSIWSTLTGQNITKATAKAGLASNQTKAKIAQQAANTAQTRATDAASAATTRNAIAQQNADTALKRANNAYDIAVKKNKQAISQSAAKGKKPDASLSRVYRHIVDSNGVAILDANGQQIPVVTTKAKKASPFDVTPKTPGG